MPILVAIIEGLRKGSDEMMAFKVESTTATKPTRPPNAAERSDVRSSTRSWPPPPLLLLLLVLAGQLAVLSSPALACERGAADCNSISATTSSAGGIDTQPIGDGGAGESGSESSGDGAIKVERLLEALVKLDTRAADATAEPEQVRDGTQDSSLAEQVESSPSPNEVKRKCRLISFEQFKVQFGKHYKSPRETAFRLRQFVANLVRVAKSAVAFWYRRSSYFLQINKLSDLSDAERRRKLGMEPDRGISGGDGAQRGEPTKALVRRKRWTAQAWFRWNERPKYELDLRAQPQTESAAGSSPSPSPSSSSKCLNEPRDQGDCGCCYAMAMMKMFEFLHCKAHGNKRIKFSEQYLVDCGRDYALSGCEKGNALGALNFVRGSGLLEWSAMPFVGEERHQCPVEAQTKALRPKRVEHKLVIDRDKWPEELRLRGPLVVYLRLSQDFYDYAGGLYETSDCDPELGHFMLLVGHGRDPKHKNRPFWLLSNSFGPHYGESGYIRVAADTSNCLVYAIGAEVDF